MDETIQSASPLFVAKWARPYIPMPLTCLSSPLLVPLLLRPDYQVFIGMCLSGTWDFLSNFFFFFGLVLLSSLSDQMAYSLVSQRKSKRQMCERNLETGLVFSVGSTQENSGNTGDENCTGSWVPGSSFITTSRPFGYQTGLIPWST